MGYLDFQQWSAMCARCDAQPGTVPLRFDDDIIPFETICGSAIERRLRLTAGIKS